MSKRVEDLTEEEISALLNGLGDSLLDSVRFSETILVSEIGEYRLAYSDPTYVDLRVDELLDGRITKSTHLAAYDSETTRYALMVNVSGYGVSTLNVDVYALEKVVGDQVAGRLIEQFDVNVPTVLNALGEFVNFVGYEATA